MPIYDLIDSEILPAVKAMPDFDISDLPNARREYYEMLAAVPVPSSPDVVEREVSVPGRGDQPPVRVRIFSPAERTEEPIPAICWAQGGGYVIPSPTLDPDVCQRLVQAHNCLVISVAWRAAPEHPFPAASEDCYTALAWMVSEAETLGIDPQRVVMAGNSSGGGTAASVALLVRDRKEFTIAHQMLVYPMLDDRNALPSTHQVTDAKVWNRTKNAIAWRAFLGEIGEGSEVLPYAAPARMEDLGGSVPASILTGELDLFRDENIVYAMRLMAADVPTELHVYPAAPHGFDRISPQAKVSRRFLADQDAILSRVFGTNL